MLGPSRRKSPNSYGYAGKCIYCGSDGNGKPLTDEHPTPVFIGGKSFIEAASCDVCAEETKYIEGYCGREIFQSVRRPFNLKGRKRKGKRFSDYAPLKLVVDDKEEEHIFPVQHHPSFLALPGFEPPGIFRDRPRTDCSTFGVKRSYWYRSTPNLDQHIPFKRTLMVPGFKGAHKITPFVRLLAKIAHGHAVGNYGLDGFKPYLPDLILGKEPYPAYLVGMRPEPHEEHWPNLLHFVDFRKMEREDGLTVICAVIRLFANIPTNPATPVYVVAVGEPIFGSDAFQKKSLAGNRKNTLP